MVTDKLQLVEKAATRLIARTSENKCGLSQLLHNDLHWLDIPAQVQYKLAVVTGLFADKTFC